jgi:nitrogenase subunit NifH
MDDRLRFGKCGAGKRTGALNNSTHETKAGKRTLEWAGCDPADANCSAACYGIHVKTTIR